MRANHLLGPTAVLSIVAGAAAQFTEPDAAALNQFDGPSPGVGAFYGWAVAEIRDLDHDGVLDAIIAEPFAPVTDDLGNTTFPGRVEVRSGATGALLLDITPPGSNSISYAVGDAGDTNGDGVNDIVASAPYNGGQAYVFSGADGSILLDLPNPAGGGFGAACAGAGDIDHDGHADVLLGAPFAGVGGQGYVVSGADGSILRTYDQGVAGEAVGWGAANAGDVDHDGQDDHILGAPFGAKAYVFSGASGALLFELNSPSATPGSFGQFFVDGLADTNADGVRDFYVGDFGVDADPNDGQFAEGEVYVYSGADGSLLLTLTGAVGDGYGPGRGAGDHDNDGCEDLAIGAYTNSEGDFAAGRIVLVSGFDGSVLKTYTSTVNSSQLGFDCVGIGDVDGDGGLDLLATGASTDVVYILAGDVRPCGADVDRDGDVDVFDLLRLLRAKHGVYDRFADLDHDGDVDLHDVLGWFAALRDCG